MFAITLKGIIPVPMQYWDNIDLDIMKWSTVIMVDFSLPREKMERLNNNTEFIWLDHHISAIKDTEWLEIQWIRDINKAWCLLAYDWIENDKTIEQTPWIYRCMYLLSMYDTRNNLDKEIWENEILPFQYGMRYSVWLDIEKAVKILNDILGFDLKNDLVWEDYYFKSLLDNWKVIINNNKTQREQWMKKSGDVEIDWLRWLALFWPAGWSSQIFESKWDNTKYDMMVYITYNITKKEYAVSLYSDRDDVDCSVVAKKFGGGGHKWASGFVCNSLPFSL